MRKLLPTIMWLSMIAICHAQALTLSEDQGNGQPGLSCDGIVYRRILRKIIEDGYSTWHHTWAASYGLRRPVSHETVARYIMEKDPADNESDADKQMSTEYAAEFLKAVSLAKTRTIASGANYAICLSELDIIGNKYGETFYDARDGRLMPTELKGHELSLSIAATIAPSFNGTFQFSYKYLPSRADINVMAASLHLPYVYTRGGAFTDKPSP